SSLLSFFFTDPSPSQIYTLSLHDALPIYFLGLLTLAAAGGLVLFLRLIRPEQLARPEGYRNLLEFLAVLRTPSHPLMPSEWASSALMNWLLRVKDPLPLILLWTTAGAFVVTGAAIHRQLYALGF